MSLDIELRNAEGDEVAWMNWLRNSFGLERWVRHNTGVDLYGVVNDHAYDDSPNVDRSAFLAKAQEALAAVEALDRATFHLPLDWGFAYTTTQEVVDRGCSVLRRYDEDRNGKAIAIAVVDADEYYRHLPPEEQRSMGWRPPALDYYRQWANEFVAFAEQLQDPALTFYCSN